MTGKDISVPASPAPVALPPATSAPAYMSVGRYKDARPLPEPETSHHSTLQSSHTPATAPGLQSFAQAQAQAQMPRARERDLEVDFVPPPASPVAAASVGVRVPPPASGHRRSQSLSMGMMGMTGREKAPPVPLKGQPPSPVLEQGQPQSPTPTTPTLQAPEAAMTIEHAPSSPNEKTSHSHSREVGSLVRRFGTLLGSPHGHQSSSGGSPGSATSPSGGGFRFRRTSLIDSVKTVTGVVSGRRGERESVSGPESDTTSVRSTLKPQRKQSLSHSASHPSPLSSSVNNPPIATSAPSSHRRAATVIDPTSRGKNAETGHDRRSSFSLRHHARRPSTATEGVFPHHRVSTAGGRVGEMGGVQEDGEEDDGNHTGEEEHPDGEEVKQVFLKGLFR
jgi:hypothetical protein